MMTCTETQLLMLQFPHNLIWENMKGHFRIVGWFVNDGVWCTRELSQNHQPFIDNPI
jgi:hypothetical protein